MRFLFAALALAAAGMITGAQRAEASPFWKPFYEEAGSSPGYITRGTRSSRRAQQRSGRRYASRSSYSGRRGVGPRPGKWCGWWMRTQLGGGPEFNLARNWRKYGRSSGPQVGAVVVWPHHVGIITGRASNGQWIVKSGNDSGRVRERARSVAGAVFRVG